MFRPRTHLKQLLSYRTEDNWRRFQSKWFRLLPALIKDKILETRYQALMGTRDGKAPEVEPGSVDAAVGEKRAA